MKLSILIFFSFTMLTTSLSFAQNLDEIDMMAQSSSFELSCPVHSEPARQYCWGGWTHGWHRCGTVCRPIPDQKSHSGTPERPIGGAAGGNGSR